jgi:effector-binding domain-containing protein
MVRTIRIAYIVLLFVLFFGNSNGHNAKYPHLHHEGHKHSNEKESGISVKKTGSQTVVALIHFGSYQQVGKTFEKLSKFFEEKGLKLSDPPSCAYFMDPKLYYKEELVAEVRFPVSPREIEKKIEMNNGMRVFNTTSLEVAFITHKGPYQELMDSYKPLFEWIQNNGYDIAGAPVEVYLKDPQNTKPEDLQTEIQVPVRKSEMKQDP